jgi:low affinity Fe/Cu permease
MPKLSFQEFASFISRGSGKPAAFIACLAMVALWGVAGPFTGYSTAWLLAINTLSSIVTLLMVFLIQNAQTRDGIAIQSKLNEIIRAVEAAENRFIGIEKLTHKELVQIETEFEAVAEDVERTAAAGEVTARDAAAS